ncbi:MAG: TIR domain-containing protein [Candidatus Polarisedimenticolaceae bacterium]|nr:TIR domain-containing protein [Candidatus Polarisedimenticolaceae bacterium]
MSKPTIFISYSHDSETHRQRVLAFSNELVKSGIDCTLDRYVETPEEGWPQWMDRSIDDADYVLMICTEIYYKRVKGTEEVGKGLGVKWEGSLINNKLYRDGTINKKFIPLLFDSQHKPFIPDILQSTTFYTVNAKEGFEDLCRRLTNQPKVIKPEIGTLKELPPERAADFFTSESPTNSPEKIYLTKLPDTDAKIFGRKKELALLDEAWQDPHKKIISFIAWGGVGKSALINGWLNQMEKDNYRGATQVYGWSFYSQGAKEGAQISADEFINDALSWFEYEGKPLKSAFNKGRALAQLITKQKVLLILDGLEPLQYPPGEMHGFLKDQALEALLKGLARMNRGLCIITSRCLVENIQSTEGHTTLTHPLEQLSKSAGRQLLRRHQIKGPDEVLELASTEFDGHALALNLVGSYLKTVFSGDIHKRAEIPKLTAAKKDGGHARRVLESYEKWFAESNRAELNILTLLGLFDRPATKAAIDVLKKSPPIPGLTERLAKQSESEWQLALSNLRELHLITGSEGQTENVDCHPLIREHFADKLQQTNEEAWRAGHGRLYDYYRNLPEKELPDTLEEMEPLFAAVKHGSLAGRVQEAMDDVYWQRIQRGQEVYTVKKLGAFGADLACLFAFFASTWDRPADGLKDNFKPAVLSWAGVALRAVGRLCEAVQPMKAGLEAAIKDENWVGAAQDANNLSELQQTLGDLKQAADHAKEAVTFADRSEDEFQMMVTRTTHADTCLQLGSFEEAERLFIAAEERQLKGQPDIPYLCSLLGSRYCDLLISKGCYPQVVERAEIAIKIAQQNNWLLDIALNNLSIGRALMLKTIENSSDSPQPAQREKLSPAEKFLDLAVNGLREAGAQDFIPKGLFARATLYLHTQQFTQAWSDLDETREIAEYGQMRLHLTDYHLQAAQLIKAQLAATPVNTTIIDNGLSCELTEEEMQTQFNTHRAEAARLINETSYHRRDEELADLYV